MVVGKIATCLTLFSVSVVFCKYNFKPIISGILFDIFSVYVGLCKYCFELIISGILFPEVTY